MDQQKTNLYKKIQNQDKVRSQSIQTEQVQQLQQGNKIKTLSQMLKKEQSEVVLLENRQMSQQSTNMHKSAVSHQVEDIDIEKELSYKRQSVTIQHTVSIKKSESDECRKTAPVFSLRSNKSSIKQYAPVGVSQLSFLEQQVQKYMYKYYDKINLFEMPGELQKLQLIQGIKKCYQQFYELKFQDKQYVAMMVSQIKDERLQQKSLQDLYLEFFQIAQEKEKWEASIFVTQIIVFIIDMIEKINTRFKNFLGFNLTNWSDHFREKLECKTDLLFLIHEKYKNLLGFSDDIKYDKNGQIISKSNYPEVKLAWFMAQDAFIYHFRNKPVYREPYNKIEILTSEKNNDLSTLQM